MKSVLARAAIIHLVVAAIGFGVYLLVPEYVFIGSRSERDMSPEALTRNTRGVFMGVVALVAAAITLVTFTSLYEQYEKGRKKIGNPVSDDELNKHIKVFFAGTVLVMIASSAVTYFAAVGYIHPLFELSLIYTVPTVIITAVAIGIGLLALIFSDPVTKLWDKFWTIPVPEPENKQASTTTDEAATAEAKQ